MGTKNKDYTIEFNKPYEFEGTKHTEVDLSEIESLSTKDLADIDKVFNTQAQGNIEVLKEMNIVYSCIVAAKVTQKPIEFFQGLPANEGIKIKNMVTGFLYS